MHPHRLICLVCLLAACASGPPPVSPPTPQELAKTSAPLSPGVYEVASARQISPGQLWQALSAARFVLLGETHDDPWHHQKQAEAFGALASLREADGGQVWLGLEMVQRPFQVALDRFVAGSIDQEEMLKQTQWQTRWGFPAGFYAPVWRQSRARGWPMVALNAPREISKRIASVGLEGLTPAERAVLPPVLDTSNLAHQAWVRRAFGAHGARMSPETFMRFYQAQVAWDETMAHTAWQALSESGGPRDQMVVLVGAGHLQHRHGIPSRLERLGAGGVKTLIFVSTPGAQASLGAPVVATEADLAAWQASAFADYVWVQ